MSWFNYWGLIAIAVIMVPNILCAVLDKGAFENSYRNKAVNTVEQIGRYGCFALMIFNIPYTWFGFWFDKAFTVYLAVGGALLLLYCLGWAVFWKKRTILRAVWLSVTPSVLFLFCGIMLRNIPLTVFALVFAVGHITVSCKNSTN